MARIFSSIKQENYKIDIQTPSGNVLIADEPIEAGGQNLGFSPKELLASALAACTSATLKMYADRKAWKLQEVKIQIDLDYIKEENKTVIHRKLELMGNLDESQKRRLLEIANLCPVHKLLTNPIEIHTELD